MKRFRAVGIIRHNTNLGGDLKLAIREFEILSGQEAQRIHGRRSLQEAMLEHPISGIPEIRSNDALVALAWEGITIAEINRLLRRSAFLQELFIFPDSPTSGGDVGTAFVAPSCRIDTLEGSIIVALAWGYVIESEGVLTSKRLSGRVRETITLLLEPYLESNSSTQSRRIRKAKKTTLSLSHDLHIYKAKFFPRMIRALLNIFGRDGAFVLDPYCGSGTALLEASLLGFDSVGVDIDPICQMISRTKVTPFLHPSETLRALDAFETALQKPSANPPTFAFPEELFRKIERRDRIDGTQFLGEIVRESQLLANAIEDIRKIGLDTDLMKVIASDAVTKKIRYRFVGVGNGRYTIEIVKQPLLARVQEKIRRTRELCYVFKELRDDFKLPIGNVEVHDGDARSSATWLLKQHADIIITSPPYLPASSGREHYAASRALSFALLGIEHGTIGYYNVDSNGVNSDFDVAPYEEADRLMTYLLSDASDTADPQRDAMRFERKALPTQQYLSDIQKFFGAARSELSSPGCLLLVVANQHTFYSHRRKELEHVVSGDALYGQIAASVGLALDEVVKMELMKSAVSKARPRASEDYFEAVLICRKAVADSHKFGISSFDQLRDPALPVQVA